MRKSIFAFNISTLYALQEQITKSCPLLCFEKIQVDQRILRYIRIFWNHHFAVLIQYQSKNSKVQGAHFDLAVAQLQPHKKQRGFHFHLRHKVPVLLLLLTLARNKIG